jgi:hypothetical protein
VIREYPYVTSLKDEDLTGFFNDLFNSSNFLKCWYYMDGYIDVDKSTELGKYFMRSKLY